MATIANFDVLAGDYMKTQNEGDGHYLRLRDITIRVVANLKDAREPEEILKKLRVIVDFGNMRGYKGSNDSYQRQATFIDRDDHAQIYWITLVMIVGLRLGWFAAETFDGLLDNAVKHKNKEIVSDEAAMGWPLIPCHDESTQVIELEKPADTRRANVTIKEIVEIAHGTQEETLRAVSADLNDDLTSIPRISQEDIEFAGGDTLVSRTAGQSVAVDAWGPAVGNFQYEHAEIKIRQGCVSDAGTTVTFHHRIRDESRTCNQDDTGKTGNRDGEHNDDSNHTVKEARSTLTLEQTTVSNKNSGKGRKRKITDKEIEQDREDLVTKKKQKVCGDSERQKISGGPSGMLEDEDDASVVLRSLTDQMGECSSNCLSVSRDRIGFVRHFTTLGAIASHTKQSDPVLQADVECGDALQSEDNMKRPKKTREKKPEKKPEKRLQGTDGKPMAGRKCEACKSSKLRFHDEAEYDDHQEKSHGKNKGQFCQIQDASGKFCYKDLKGYGSKLCHKIVDHDQFELGRCLAKIAATTNEGISSGKTSTTSCNVQLNTLEEAKAHMLKHHGPWVPKGCPIGGCGNERTGRKQSGKFETLATYKSHLIRVHGTSISKVEDAQDLE